jgi:glycosyltransferase involved in cell wall biosynthesis
MPKVSVIIPAHNAEPFLAQSLDSVFAQTYTNFETIVIDDGSNDGTAEVVRYYQRIYPGKIKLIQKKNGGPASARNAGIKEAKGEYIAFLDADDLWLPSKLKKQVDYFEKQNSTVGMVYTDVRKFDNEGIWLVNRHRSKFVSGSIYKILLKSNMISNLSVMVRKKCFDHVGFFDENEDIIEDCDMWLRIALKFDIGFLDEILGLYRQHPQGRSKNIEKTIKRFIRVYQKHLTMFSENNEIVTIIRKYIANQLNNLGYVQLKNGKIAESRKSFRNSLHFNFLPSSLFFILLSFLPNAFLHVCNNILKLIFRPKQIKKVQSLDTVLSQQNM